MCCTPRPANALNQPNHAQVDVSNCNTKRQISLDVSGLGETRSHDSPPRMHSMGLGRYTAHRSPPQGTRVAVLSPPPYTSETHACGERPYVPVIAGINVQIPFWVHTPSSQDAPIGRDCIGSDATRRPPLRSMSLRHRGHVSPLIRSTSLACFG